MSKRANGNGGGAKPKKPKTSLSSLKSSSTKEKSRPAQSARRIAKNDWRTFKGKIKERIRFDVRDAPRDIESDRLFDIKDNEDDQEFHSVLFPPLEIKWASLGHLGQMTNAATPTYNVPPQKSSRSLALWLDPPPLPEELEGKMWTRDYHEKCVAFADFVENEYQAAGIEALVDDPGAQKKYKATYFAGKDRDEKIAELVRKMRNDEKLKIFRDERTGRRYIRLTSKSFKTKSRGSEAPPFDETRRSELEDPRKRIAYCKTIGYTPKFIKLRQQKRNGGPWEVVPGIEEIQLDQEILFPGNFVIITAMMQVSSYKLGCGINYVFFPDICLVSQYRREQTFEISTDIGGDTETFSLAKTEAPSTASANEDEEEGEGEYESGDDDGGVTQNLAEEEEEEDEEEEVSE